MSPLHPDDVLNPGPTSPDPMQDPSGPRGDGPASRRGEFISVNATDPSMPIGKPPRRRNDGPTSINPTH